MIGGTNYVTALTTAMFYFFVLCGLLAKHQYKKFYLLIPFALFMLSFLINALAPGNLGRQSRYPDHPDILSAVFLSFRFIVPLIRSWCTLPLLCLVAFTIPVFWSLASNARFSFPYPLLVVLFSFCLLAAMIYPPVYSMGSTGDDRLTDIIFDAFVLLVLFNTLYVVGWICHAYNTADHIPQYSRVFLMSFSVLIILGCIFDQGFKLTSPSALRSLCSGEAAAYYDTFQQRLEILHDESVPNAVVPAFQDRPYVIFLGDLCEWDEGWRSYIASYYGKDSVTLE